MSEHSAGDRASRTSISGTHHLVLIETHRAQRPSRRGWMVVVLPILFALAVLTAVRELSRIERALAKEGDRAARVVVYEVAPGGELRFPIEPRTDVLRVVVHAVGRGALAPTPHAVAMTLTLRGDHGTRTDVLPFVVPATSERVTPEDQGLSVGDPIGVNVDAHGVGAGVATLRVDRVDGADALLVRVYRREELGTTDAARRGGTIDPAKRAHLARRAGEIDWIDLDEGEQAVLAASRWRKVAALPTEGERLVTRAIALAPPPPAAPARPPGSIGTFSLEETERAAVVARGPVTIWARAAHGGRVTATLHEHGGAARGLEATGELAIDIPPGAIRGVELGLDDPGLLSLRASDPTRVEMPMRAPYWRTTPAQPIVVEAGADGSILRVSARRSLPRTQTTPVSLTLVVEVRDGSGAALGGPAASTATVARSAFDRYEGADGVAPSERAVFYVVVPPRARARMWPPDGVLDVTLAELDPRAAPSTSGFVARAPSNARDLADASGILRLAHRLGVAQPQEKLATLRVKARAGRTLVVGHRAFRPIEGPFSVEMPGGAPMLLPMRLTSQEPVDVVVSVDGDRAVRRPGVVAHVTTARAVALSGELRTAIILGDDLAPGPHTITFQAPPGKRVWVHMPWLGAPHGRGGRPPETHWITGDFDP